MKYTRTPWRLDETLDDIFNMGPAIVGSPSSKTNTGHIVAFMNVGPVDRKVDWDWKANAELLAAAPSMYEALRAIKARLEMDLDNPCLKLQGDLCGNVVEDIRRFVGNVLQSIANGEGEGDGKEEG